MLQFRELICAVSCRTFVGKYVPNKIVKKMTDDYYDITAALDLVNFPIIIPFTQTWSGKKCAEMILEQFCTCAAKAKTNILSGGKPIYIMDRSILNMITSEEYRKNTDEADELQGEKPYILIRWSSDIEISMTIFNFLFASVGTSSSACTWLFQLLADRPEILDRVREESLHIRGGDCATPLTLAMVDEMVFTRAVVKETLRYRPPVIMMPYVIKKDYPVTESYSIPKGKFLNYFVDYLIP